MSLPRLVPTRARAVGAALAAALAVTAPGTSAPPAAAAPFVAATTATPGVGVTLVPQTFTDAHDMVWARGRLFVSAGDEVLVLDPQGKVRKRIKEVPDALGMAVSPTGDRVYVAVFAGARVDVIDTRRLKVIHRWQTDPCTADVALAGSRLFYSTMSCFNKDASVKSIDAKKGGKPVSTGIHGFYDPILLAGGGTTLVAADPDSHPITVTSYRVKGSKVSRQAAKDDNPTSLTTTRDGRTVYVTREYAPTVEGFPTSTLRHPVSYASPGGTPSSLAVRRDGRRLAVALTDADDDLLVYRVGSTSSSWSRSTTRTGPQRPRPVPGTLTYSDDGKRLFELLAGPGGPDDPRSDHTRVYFATSRT